MSEQAAIMNPEHPRWAEFIRRLGSQEGCNFRKSAGTTRWICFSDHRFSRAILESMSNINVEDSIHWLMYHGGYCDCEILFNLDRTGGSRTSR